MLIRTLIIALAALPAAADGLGELKKSHAAAFKPLRLKKPSQWEQEIVPRLPQGIVIEAAPFHALVKKLLEPYDPVHGRRISVLRRLAKAESPEVGRLVQSAFKTLEKEDAEWAKRVRGVEAAYAEVYNRGYMESSESARRTRKAAAVLVPLYRTLLARNGEVADAAVDALASLKAGDGFAWLTGPALSGGPALRAAAARALARIGGDDARSAVARLAVRDADPSVRIRALASLPAFKTSLIREVLVDALADPAWEVRALAIAICVRAKLVEAAGAMIGALEKESGRLRRDLDEALHALTGVRMYGDLGLWKNWWAANREAIQKKAKALEESGAYDKALGPVEGWEDEDAGAEGVDEKKRKGNTSAFYGISTQSKRILFVLDISRSMQDAAGAKPAAPVRRKKDPYPAPRGSSKLDVAKWQLHRAVHALPKDAVFNIVVYSESYKVWTDEMTAASKGNKKKAHKFVDQINGNGVTNIGDSLDKAFELAGVGAAKRKELALDTVFLLSDGDPNRGRISDLNALLRDFVARNRLTRLVVHTVGIGEAAGSSFLKELAKRTGGQYVEFR